MKIDKYFIYREKKNHTLKWIIRFITSTTSDVIIEVYNILSPLILALLVRIYFVLMTFLQDVQYNVLFHRYFS